MTDLVVARTEGLYCPPGQFYIDPWRAVDRAVITHAHADHARSGHAHYLATQASEQVLRTRLGQNISLQTLAYGEHIEINGVTVSLHPAGHVLGSAQVRLEYQGQIWVVSGDYKLMSNAEQDQTCASFESVPCHVFITESTFGLPVYRWKTQAAILAEIQQWWQDNARQQRTSVLYCYAFGKAQRILSALDPATGPLLMHGAIEKLNQAYRSSGVSLPATRLVSTVNDKSLFSQALVLAPPSAQGTAWMKRFGDYSDAFASGWMSLRGARRRQALDRGFVLSDHADWPGLQQAIRTSGAERIIVTHGQVPVMIRWLNEQGLNAEAFASTELSMQYNDHGHDDPDPTSP
jgi:putative mRNA 3-end processing factor